MKDIKYDIEYLIEWSTYFGPIVKWSFFWHFMTLVVSPRIGNSSEIIQKWKRSQSNETLLDWNLRITSAVNSFLVFPFSTFALISSLDWSDMYSDSYYGRLSMNICAGYFIHDFCVVIYLRNYYPQIIDFIIHHIVSIVAFTLCEKNNALFWFANVRLLSEFSTPFVNLRWILNQLNLRQSRIYDLNRKITFYAFLFFRIIPIPIYWSVAIYNYRTQTFSNLDIPLKTILLVSGIALDILNINWFGKLSKGMNSTKNEKNEKNNFKNSEDPTEHSFLNYIFASNKKSA